MSRRNPRMHGSFTIFFACPISEHIDRVTSRLQPDYERFIRAVHALLRGAGGEVFLALERERWGEAIMPAEVCAPLDFAEMQRCDVVVAYPGRSCGVAVELGWASALGKPIVLLVDATATASPLVRGIGALPGQRACVIDIASAAAQATIEPFSAELIAALRRFDAWAPDAARPAWRRSAGAGDAATAPRLENLAK